MAKFSAYISIYNDWDILPEALVSIKDYIDELVVVDGAYEWMSSYLVAIGKNPSKSDDKLYKIIEESGIKHKIIARQWKDEIEKRMAGYEACSGDYVFRIDADEILFFYDGALQRFLESGKAVAEMEIPLYDGARSIQTQAAENAHPRLGFLFDKSKVSADQHLHYLWLVLGDASLPPYSRPQDSYYPEAIAFGAHLSHWRTPQGSVQRAAFYIMLWMRSHGIPQLMHITERPITNFDPLFEVVPADHYLGALLRHPICTGSLRLAGEAIKESPLSREQQDSFLHLFHRKMDAIEQLNKDAMADWQPFVAGQEILLEASHGILAEIISKNNRLGIQIDKKIAGIQAARINVIENQPYYTRSTLQTEIDGEHGTVIIEHNENAGEILRYYISLIFHLGDDSKLSKFKILS